MTRNNKIILSFSLLTAYLLSIQFEGFLLMDILNSKSVDTRFYMSISMWSHFFGLLISIIVIPKVKNYKNIFKLNFIILSLSLLVFFFKVDQIWKYTIILSGIASALATISYAYIIQSVCRKERMKLIAYTIIWANVFLIVLNIINDFISIKAALILLFLFVILSNYLILVIEDQKQELNLISYKQNLIIFIKLWVFIFLVTLISGIMYRVIIPEYYDLKYFSYTWVLPYILSIYLMSNKEKYLKTKYLNISMGFMLISFLGLLLIQNIGLRFIYVNTLLLFALGILDYFWWAIMADLLNTTEKPNFVFSFVLSANVFGILVGELIGAWGFIFNISRSSLVVIVMSILSITIMMNTSLVEFLSKLFNFKQNDLCKDLSKREKEVLNLVIQGYSNIEIGETLHISENTVRTHMRNILAKHDVKNRVELISKYVNHP